MSRRCLILLNRRPQSDRLLTELLDEILTFAAFDDDIGLLLLDDAVCLPFRSEPGQPVVPSPFRELLDAYGIGPIWIEAESLASRGLRQAWDHPGLRVLPRREVAATLARHGRIIGL